MNKQSILSAIYGLLANPELSHLFSSEIAELGVSRQFGKLKVDEVVNFERTSFAGLSSRVDLLSQSAVIKDGFSSFHNRKVENDTVVYALKFLFAEAVTADTNEATADYSFKKSAFPTELLNAYLEVEYNGGKVVKLPVRELVYDGTEKRNLEGYYSHNLLNPIVIKEGTPLRATIQMPDGVSVQPGANNSFFAEIQFIGASMRVRTN